MWKKLRIRDMESRQTASLTTRYLALPTNYVEMRRLRLVSGSNNYNIDYEAPSSMIVSADTSIPKYFTVTSQLEFDRTPDGTYTAEMELYISLTALSDSNTSNAVLSRFPMIYLFGSLWALWLFASEEDKADYYYGMFDKAIRDANAQDSRGRYGPAPAARMRGTAP